MSKKLDRSIIFDNINEIKHFRQMGASWKDIQIKLGVDNYMLRTSIDLKKYPRFIPGTYQCSCCGKILPISEFYANKRMARGHQSQCKSCNINNAMIWKRVYPERANEHARQSKLRRIIRNINKKENENA